MYLCVYKYEVQKYANYFINIELRHMEIGSRSLINVLFHSPSVCVRIGISCIGY